MSELPDNGKWPKLAGKNSPHFDEYIVTNWDNDDTVVVFEGIENDEGFPIHQATGERMVKCWNACAGIPDPAAELARLRKIEEAATNLLHFATEVDGFEVLSQVALHALRTELEAKP